ncbi:MAG: hypothetical protein Q4D98_07765 [Planctomycetia bacterium]|nr:hypothetical protein [Planctomycetia bacterium]
MRWIIALFLLWAPLVACAEEPDWSQGQLIYGDPVLAGETKGKVLFFIYWGADCAPCRMAMMELRKYQAQLASSGAFCVVASHCQNNQEGALAFLRQANIKEPLHKSLILSGRVP